MTPSIPLVDLGAQFEEIGAEVRAAIDRVLAANTFILGREVELFEEEFAAFCGAKYCVACGNGTDALVLAMEALKIGRGDEVITVSHTFFATAEAISMVGARPVFVDVRDDTLLMDTRALESAITPNTRAIIPVHLYGQMVDMEPLMTIARRHGLAVIEDAAQAHGARRGAHAVGAVGDVAAFSFFPGKNLGAYGDAGAIVTEREDVAAYVRKARNHGRLDKYVHEHVARNSRMDSLQAAVLRVKLKRLAAWNERRREIASIYDSALRRSRARPVELAPESVSARHLYVVRTDGRDAVLKGLHEAGIGAGVHYPVPVHLQPAYAHLGLEHGSLPVTKRVAEEVISLPLYPELSVDDANRVVRTLLAATGDDR